MIKIGEYADLEVIKFTDFGAYLDGGAFGEILLPGRYVPIGTHLGQDLHVFIYCDSEDRIIATTEKPLATVGQFAALECKQITPVGAFLDWGLPKDLLVPMREQRKDMQVGQIYVVYVYLDEKTDRIVASAKLNRFVKAESEGLNVGDEVSLLIVNKTDLGFKAIVNSQFWGVLYDNEVFRPLRSGQVAKGYIKRIREEDKKLDLSLQPQGYDKNIPTVSEKLLIKIKKNSGFLNLTDKSSPEEIYATLGISKKNI